MYDAASTIKNYQWAEFLISSSEKTIGKLSSTEQWIVFLWLGGKKPSIEISLSNPKLNRLNLFVKSIQDLEHGNIKSSKQLLSQGKRWPTDERWMLEWIKIEIEGRFNKGRKLSKILNTIDLDGNEFFYSYAILRSFSHKKIEDKIKKELIEKFTNNKKILNKIILYKLMAIWGLDLNPPIEPSQFAEENVQTTENICKGLVYQTMAEMSAKNDEKNTLTYYFKSFQHGHFNLVNAQYALQLSISFDNDAFFQIVKVLGRYGHLSIELKRIIDTHIIIDKWTKGEIISAINICNLNKHFYEITPSNLNRISHAYFVLIARLIKYIHENKVDYDANTNCNIYLLGESHCLAGNNFIFNLDQEVKRGKSLLVTGVKMSHVNSKNDNLYKKALINRINSIPKGSTVIFTIGEIDTRHDEGIYEYSNKYNVPLNEIINSTVKSYIDFIYTASRERGIEVIIQGTPAPVKRIGVDFNLDYLSMIVKVNEKLKEIAIINGFRFFDIYSLTSTSDGISNEFFHLDNFHCSPKVYKYINNFLQ